MSHSVTRLIGLMLGIGLSVAPLQCLDAPGNDSLALKADRALVQAVAKEDKKAAVVLLHTDFSATNSSGKTREKVAILKNLHDLPVGDADLVVHQYGDVAYLTGTQTASSPGSGKIRIVRVWVKNENEWQAILQQDTVIVGKTATAQATVPAGTPCENPCKSIPYKAPSVEAAAVVASWEALEDAVNHRDANGWAAHVADEFVFNVKEDGNPLTKADRVAIINKQKLGNTVTDIGTVIPDSMKVWVYGDTAVMSDEQQPTQGGPPYRAMRIWVKRDGRWQLVYSQQTVIESVATATH
jgi:ketosteroid isomerase-like protein